MNTRQMVLTGIVLSLFCVEYAAEAKGVSEDFPDNEILAEFKIARDGDAILLPVEFNGKEYSFLLDTGSSHTVFDTSLRQALGGVERIEKGATAKGVMNFEIFNAPDAYIGSFNVKDCGEITCLDLKVLSMIVGRDIHGIIGTDFLKKYVIQIDFDRGILSFLNPTKLRNLDLGEKIAMNYHSSGIPQIKGGFSNDVFVDFMIDTGTVSTGSLDKKVFEEVLSRNVVKTSDTLVYTAGGAMQEKEARMSVLSVGQLRYQNLIFTESNITNLGLSFLSRHLVTIDFLNNNVYLKKGRKFEKVDEVDMSGLHLIFVSNEIVVHSVDEGSPAHRAGINANDVITNIGKENANVYSLWEIRQLLSSKDGREIKMAVKRGITIREAHFFLKKKI